MVTTDLQPQVSQMCLELVQLCSSTVGFIISYYIYIYINEYILIKVQMAVSATAGTSTPLAGDYKVDCIGH